MTKKMQIIEKHLAHRSSVRLVISHSLHIDDLEWRIVAPVLRQLVIMKLLSHTVVRGHSAADKPLQRFAPHAERINRNFYAGNK